MPNSFEPLFQLRIFLACNSKAKLVPLLVDSLRKVKRTCTYIQGLLRQSKRFQRTIYSPNFEVKEPFCGLLKSVWEHDLE